MKILFKQITVLAIVFGSFVPVFAEEVDLNSFNVPWNTEPVVNTLPESPENQVIWDTGYSPYTQVDFNQFNTSTFDNAATVSGTVSCVDCNSVSGVIWDTGYSPYTQVDFNQFNTSTFDNAATYSGSVNCVNCYGTQYVAPTYTTGATYNTGVSYVSPTYTGSTYGNTYSYPTYGGSSYTYPTYSYPTTVPVTNTTRCSDGSAPINGSCNRTTTIPVTTNTVCSDGQASINGSCVRNNTIPTTTNTLCSDGSAPINGSCNRTTTIPVTTNTVCSDGQAPINGSCVRNNTIPTVVNTICSDGSAPINGSCVRVTTTPVVTYQTSHQTCWDGSVIPSSSVCASQYKMCANGVSVPINQNCYVTTAPVIIPQQVVKFNNVVTSIATQITHNSGRCNGIGLIANNAASTGWFEYGETSNLGRTTATANIGSANTAPFSNVLANLKPNTKYYCRAVMQNQYGLIKGEIVSFVTKSAVTTYVKPVTSKPVTTKTPVKKNEIVCSDGSTVNVSNQSAATLLNQGQKLLAVQIEKQEGTLSPGKTVNYRVNYKNLTDTRLHGVVVKVTLPQEIVFVSSNAGNFDGNTRTLTLSQDTIDPYTEASIVISGAVIKEAPLGKTVVTNVYANYTIPSTNTQDEVAAYIIGSITPVDSVAKTDTGAKKVVGTASKSFLPGSLIEWLALLAILFIIFILGRSIYASYKDEEGNKH